MELQDQVALVTGAAVRVGRAIAMELARAGCRVVVHYHTHQGEAEALSADLRAAGRRSEAVRADLAEPQAACEALLAAADRLGTLRAVVNNASIYAPGGPGEMAPDALARLWRVNVEAPTLLGARAAERMAAAGPQPGGRGCGAVVNVLDVQARRPWPRYLAYCMSKAALESTTRGQARRFAPQVRFNGVAPGIVLWNDADGAELRERLLSAVPMGRFGQPTDVAAAVRMLLENDYITGQVLNVDGGRSM